MKMKFNPELYTKIKEVMETKPTRIQQTVLRWERRRSDGERINYPPQTFIISEEELLQHIKKAKSLPNATISLSETEITVKRVGENEMMGVTTVYMPIKEGDSV